MLMLMLLMLSFENNTSTRVHALTSIFCIAYVGSKTARARDVQAFVDASSNKEREKLVLEFLRAVADTGSI